MQSQLSDNMPLKTHKNDKSDGTLSDTKKKKLDNILSDSKKKKSDDDKSSDNKKKKLDHILSDSKKKNDSPKKDDIKSDSDGKEYNELEKLYRFMRKYKMSPESNRVQNFHGRML